MLCLLACWVYLAHYDGPAACSATVAHCRAQARSADAGATWAPATLRADLPDPQCKGGVAPWRAGRGLLLAHCASTHARANVTLRVSVDDGDSWPFAQVVSLPGGYVDVAAQAWVGGNGTELALVAFEADTCAVSLARVQPALVVGAAAARV